MRVGAALTLAEFRRGMASALPLEIAPEVEHRVAAAHRRIEEIADGEAPVYGLNTGLGANLDHRIAPEDIPAFQMQIVAGRAMAVGAPLPEEIGRGALLSRICSASTGLAGMSPGLFAHLSAVYRAGLAPVLPEFGSIGVSDLVQNASAGLGLCGEGRLWGSGSLVAASEAFARHGLKAPTLRPKDGLALISHSGVSHALAGEALGQARDVLDALKSSAVLSFEGYSANRQIFELAINNLRTAPGQAEIAAWFRQALEGSAVKPRRVQDALSFRTLAPVYGAAEAALSQAIAVFEDELNGSSDSPVVLAEGGVQSTPNFMTPALALALESTALAFVGVAQSSVQRMQRLMTPELSGLPRYLSTGGPASAGWVPSQKTAASLFARIKQCALPALPDAAPVSEAVEDMASTTPQSAAKLTEQSRALRLLAGLEALVAAEAIDFGEADALGPFAARVHGALRARIPFRDTERAIDADIDAALDALDAERP